MVLLEVNACPRLQKGCVGPTVERGWAVDGWKSAAVAAASVSAAAAADAAGAALHVVLGPSLQ